MNRRIDIISNDKEIIKSIKETLIDTDIISYKTINNFRRENISLLLIDSQLFFDEDSIQFLLSKIRKKTLNIPVVAIFKNPDIDNIYSYYFIDDFIIFPFRRGELSTRINRLCQNKNNEAYILSAGNLKIDLNEYSVYNKDIKIDLTFKEFEILRLLMTNKKTVFSREELLNHIWGMEYIGGTRTVDVHIRRLRSKLGEEFDSFIGTVRNVGYKWIQQ